MTKKSRIILITCAAFISAVFLFTSAFLVYLQGQALPDSDKALEEATKTSSSYAIISGTDLYTLLITLALFGIFIYFIIKS